MSKLVGYVIAGRYRVDEFLGRGGMAEVYKVWDQQRATWLAMKVLHESLAEDKVFLRRFRREATNLAKLRHPNIVRFYEWGESGELVFILMEYVSGITLSKALKRSGKPFTPSQALGIIQPVCSALHYAHEQGLAHCDIKPSNIMLDESGRVFLTDFGIARVTEGSATATMVGAGTPAYMSPEQVDGADPTPQTDIYAIGVVLFELFTGGERPFTGERASITGTMGEKIRWEKRKLSPPSPRKYNSEISPAVENVIMVCLSRDLRARYNSVTIILDELVRGIGDNVETLPPSVFVDPTIKFEKPAPKRRVYLVSGLVGCAVILVAVLGVVGVTFYNLQNRTEPQSAISQPAPLVQKVTEVVTRVVDVTSVVPTEKPTERPTDPPPPTKRPATSTPRPPTKPVAQSLSVDVATEGGVRYVKVKGGSENYDITFGPVSDGELIEGPNDIFCAYVDINGNVYIGRYDTSEFRTIENVKKQFSSLRSGTKPVYDLRLLADDNGTFTLYIYEREYGEDYAIKLPRNLTLK